MTKVDFISKEHDGQDFSATQTAIRSSKRSELTSKNQSQLRNAIVHGMHNGQQKEQSRTDISGRALTQPDNRESERTHGTQMMAQLDQNMN